MSTLIISLLLLVGGYAVYGAVMSRIVRIDPKAKVPAIEKADGVDFVPLPAWKVFLIQFLNIAGLGPIFGAIMGIMFGPAAFLWIVFGTIFAGAVHDFVSGVMSLRSDGASLPELVGQQLGLSMKHVMRVFSLILLVLVGTVFVVSPADLIATMTPEWMDKTFWIVVIFVYYTLATLLPIDKLIGNLYPLFGLALLFMAVGLLAVMLSGAVNIPDGVSDGFYNRHPKVAYIFPMMFVSIACGAISGFHATQSPMMARCLKNEKLARPIFYGAMVAEGIVALVWAAAAVAFTGGYEQLADYMAAPGHSAGSLVKDVSVSWLGPVGGALAILGVIVAPISTGDTALRSARLIVADFMHFDQSKLWRRVLISLPIFVAAFALMLIDFNVLWRYFAWSNQTLSCFTLWAATVWLARKGSWYIVTLLPALFMTVVCVTYFLFAPRPEGLGLPIMAAVGAGVIAALAMLLLFATKRKKLAE